LGNGCVPPIDWKPGTNSAKDQFLRRRLPQAPSPRSLPRVEHSTPARGLFCGAPAAADPDSAHKKWPGKTLPGHQLTELSRVCRRFRMPPTGRHASSPGPRALSKRAFRLPSSASRRDKSQCERPADRHSLRGRASSCHPCRIRSAQTPSTMTWQLSRGRKTPKQTVARVFMSVSSLDRSQRPHRAKVPAASR
jgi:hypothetical protein